MEAEQEVRRRRGRLHRAILVLRRVLVPDVEKWKGIGSSGKSGEVVNRVCNSMRCHGLKSIGLKNYGKRIVSRRSKKLSTLFSFSFLSSSFPSLFFSLVLFRGESSRRFSFPPPLLPEMAPPICYSAVYRGRDALASYAAPSASGSSSSSAASAVNNFRAVAASCLERCPPGGEAK